MIWPIDGTLTDATNLSQSGPESNGKEEVFHIPESFRTRAAPSDSVQYYTLDTRCRWGGGLTPL